MPQRTNKEAFEAPQTRALYDAAYSPVVPDLTVTELDRMQDTQEGAMMDECTILSYSSTTVSGEVQDGWSGGGTPVACGLNTKKSKEIHKEDLSIVRTDAQLRLPIGTTIEPRDRIQVLSRFNVTEDEQLIYGIEGEPRKGPSGLLLDLVIVEPGVNR